MVAGYFTTVFLYYLFGYLFLPDEVCATGVYILGAFAFPFVLLVLIGLALPKAEHDATQEKTMDANKSVGNYKELDNGWCPECEMRCPGFGGYCSKLGGRCPKGDATHTTSKRWITIDNSNGLGHIHVAQVENEAGSMSSIDRMDGRAFELWCADLLRETGFIQVNVTAQSGDQGVDITAEKDGVKYAFQCKCYSADLGNRPIQEVHSGKYVYGCHVGVVMTNRGFTKGAKELAQATGTLLWDRDKLKLMVQQSAKRKNESSVKL